MEKIIKTPLSAMRNFVTIMRKTEIADSAGGFELQWQELGKAWVKITPLKSQETIYLSKKINLNFYEITMRYMQGIEIEQKIIFRKKEMIVKSVTEQINGQKILILLAQEKI